MAITNITEALDALKTLAEGLPAAVTVDDTLSVEGAAADAKAVGEAISSLTADKIGSGTFAGQVVANSTAQAPATMLLRNSSLVTAETNPSNNGEIVWQYG